MLQKKEAPLAKFPVTRDPFALFREMASDFDRFFEEPSWPWYRRPLFRGFALPEAPAWAPGIDVFERENYLVTKVDLPGMKKEDVKVEITEGRLVISGERKKETEEKKDNVFRSEREYGSFYRAVPLPDGVKFDDVKATFMDGVLEVSIPLPALPEQKTRTVEVKEPAVTGAKSAA
jgi:HSP20 family protein